MEENLVILYKTITWRIVATAITFAIAFLVLGRVDIASGIAVFDMLVKMIAYIAHEKGWLWILRNSKKN